jgi:hypothetical protein
MSLAALVPPRKKAADLSSYPKPVDPELLERVPLDGMSVRINWCEVHQLEYFESISAQLRDGRWHGFCPECNSAEGIERRAKVILAERRDEVSRRVAERMAACAAEIAAAVEERLAEHCASVRAEIAEDVEWQARQREQEHVTAELLAEIREELRAGKTEARVSDGRQ